MYTLNHIVMQFIIVHPTVELQRGIINVSEIIRSLLPDGDDFKYYKYNNYL